MPAERLALVDIDGVLADTRHRDRFAVAREWGTYFGLMHLDGVWRQGVELVENIQMCGYDLAYLTGRREDMKRTTTRWLRQYRFPDAPLIMRREDDRTKLAYLKAGVVRDADLLYPSGVTLWDDDPWVVEEVNNVCAGAAVQTTWYVKPASVVRRAES